MTIIDDDKIIFLNFFDKGKFKTEAKSEWDSEPDFLLWTRHNLKCLVIRNQETGCWRGLVGVKKDHPGYNKTMDLLLDEKWALELDVYGGITFADFAPDFGDEIFWFGTEMSNGGDLLPLDAAENKREEIKGPQTYKNFKFIRKEVNSLAAQLAKVGEKK